MATWNWNDYIDPTKQGLLALAKQYADAGMMARAKKAFESAGGTWTNEIHRQFKTEAAATTRYGGDISFKWGDYGVRTQAQLNQIIEWAKTRDYRKIKNMIDGLGGTKKWNNQLRTKLAAEYEGKQEKDTDATTAGWQGTRTTEFKRDEPEVAPVLYEPSTNTQGDDTTWKQQFQGKITPGQVGAWGEGGSQQRKDAQKWRNLHMNAAIKKHGLTRGSDNKIARPEGMSDADWGAWADQRNKIATRFRKMIGHGEFAQELIMALPNVITYAYIRGRWYAFADSDSAYAGVTKYKGNAQSLRHSKPVGAIIDDTTLINQGFWPDSIADAPGVTGSALVEPPYNPITGTGTDPITPDTTTTDTTGGNGGTTIEQEFSGPDKKVWDFREYVEGNPDLLNAFQAYKQNQDAAKIDSWEKQGIIGSTALPGMGGVNRNPNLPTGYGGSELNIEQWGNIHYGLHGKNENRTISAQKNVAGNDPRYQGRWDDFLVT